MTFAVMKRFVAKNGIDNNNNTLTNVANPVNTTDVVNLATQTIAITTALSAAAADATTKVNAAQAAATAASTPLSHVGTGAAAHAAATTSVNGFMSSTDKTKLDGITGTNTGDQTNISGNAGTATLLQTGRNINGVTFDGSTNITINAVDITARVASSLLGAVNGVATLDGSGLVPASQLPSYVDDVLEYTNLAGFPVAGVIGKIYVALDTNKTYRWSGSAYVYITSGAVDSVAGKTGVVTLVKADVGLSNVDNTTDLNKPVSTAAATDATTKANAAQAAAIAASAPIAHVGTGAAAHAAATTSVNGFMSSTDKTKLDGITVSGTNTGDETLATIKTKLGITTLSGSNTGDQTTITGNAGSATVLQTPRTIASVSFNGSADISIPFGNLTARPTTIAGYGITDGVSLASPTFTGVPAAPTAAVGTNTTQLATTAFVNAEIANDAPSKTGTGASGSWGISVTGSSASCTGNAATVTNGVYTTTIDYGTTLNNQTGTTYTTVLTDGAFVGNVTRMLTFNNAAAQTVTIPPNSSVNYPVGTTIQMVQLGAGKVTIAAGAGVTINSVGGLKSIGAQYAAVTLIQTSANVWLLAGSLIA